MIAAELLSAEDIVRESDAGRFVWRHCRYSYLVSVFLSLSLSFVTSFSLCLSPSDVCAMQNRSVQTQTGRLGTEGTARRENPFDV
jgi:hypothetical protein